ncbi:MAG: mandelate racemase/muconate lactonizing enzyme family protein [SAR324 cluster bacterium]|nr:mandelate racemase/muconate lactonizing enzyme family protein [SAR324 cluster bacterium]
MNVSDVKTFVVANPPPHHGGPYFVFLKLVTDNGIEGLGEVYGVPFHPSVTERMIVDVAERQVIGRSPFQIETLWRNVYSRGYAQHPDHALMGVLSGIEMACWDIVGKALDQPVYNLLGGQVHEKLRSYTYLYPAPADERGEDSLDIADVFGDAERGPQRAAKYVAQGFTGVKFDPVMPMGAFDPRQLSLEALDRAETFASRIREAVGSRCDLLLGTHGQMTTSSAIRLARRLEPYDPLWFEEPVPPENVDAMATLQRSTNIPIATAEGIQGHFHYRELLTQQAARIWQPDVARVGGITAMKKIAALADTGYITIAPHNPNGPVCAAASMHIAASIPNFLIMEEGNRQTEQYGDIFLDGWNQSLAEWNVPESPGLGIELTPDFLREFTVAG